MASTQRNSEPSNGDNDTNAILVESLDGPHDFIEVQADTAIRRALSKAAFIFYICTIMAYIFLSLQGPGEDLSRFKIARLVVVIIWMINSGVLFICHTRYLIRYKREIASVFFISALSSNYLVGAGGSGIADGMGIIMVCIVIATLSPGALGSIIGATQPP